MQNFLAIFIKRYWKFCIFATEDKKIETTFVENMNTNMTMKRIVLLMVVMYASLTCMAIELKNLRDNCVVKNSDGWYYLRTRLIWFDEYPELQKELTRVLFDREQTSVKQGYSQYVNSFRSIKSARENMNKSHGKEIQIKIGRAHV